MAEAEVVGTGSVNIIEFISIKSSAARGKTNPA
jgi:hypothetical protein